MEEFDDIQEVKTSGLEIQSAVLHILDGRRHRIVFSEQTLDLEEALIEKYVRRYVNRCRNDMRTRPGTFRENSAFQKEMGKYFLRETDLCSFSKNTVKPLVEYFEREEARSFEVLAVDYRLEDVPYILFVLLEECETLTCMSESNAGRIRNTVSFSNSALPAVSKAVSCFALVNMLSGEIAYVDEGKWNNDAEVIKDRFLEANGGISRREVMHSVREIAHEVAEEFQENPAVMLGRVKSYIAETAEEGMPLNTETLVLEVFEEEPEIAEVFRQKVEEKTLPKEVELPKASIRMSMKKQKIRTDTGIEITFPTAYSENRDYIDFVRNDDGSLTIEIRSVNKINSQI